MKRNPYPNQKPMLGAEVDWRNPLSRGLVGCWLFNEGAGGGCQELVTNITRYIGSGKQYLGNGLYADGTTYGAISSGVLLTPYHTITARTRPTNPSDNPLIADCNSGASDESLTWRYLRSAGINWVDSGGGYGNAITPSDHQSVWATDTVSYDGIGRAYKNGVLYGSTAAFTIRTATRNASLFTLGLYTSAQFYMGDCEFLYIHSRALSPSEVAQLYYEPYGHFLVPGLPIYYSIPSGIVDANIAAVIAEAAAAGIVPALRADSTVAAVTAESTAASINPSLRGDSTLLAIVAEAIAAGVDPSLRIDSLLAAVVAEATADGIVPAVTADAIVAAIIAEATADGVVPSIRVDSTLAAVIAQATAEGLVPSFVGDPSTLAPTPPTPKWWGRIPFRLTVPVPIRILHDIDD
jgi:hypothetical protein